MRELSEAALLSILQQVQGKNIWIAYSAGMDSHVLVDLCANLQNKLPQTIRLIHVNHQLQIDADKWQSHAEQVAKSYGVEIVTEAVQLASKGNLEANARQARLDIFKNLLQQGDVVLTAHHQRDQAETFLLQLARGAGLSGLSSMPIKKNLGEGFLIRPFLYTPYAELHDYAKAQQLAWCEDPTNQSLEFDRNFLRHEIIPKLSARWPEIERTIAKATEHFVQQHIFASRYLQSQLAAICVAGQLDVKKLLAQKEIGLPEQLLRTWLLEQTGVSPSKKHLAELMKQLAIEKKDEIIWHYKSYRLTCYRGKLAVLPSLNADEAQETYSLSWSISTNPILSLPNSGCMEALTQVGQGFSVAAIKPGQVLTVRNRAACPIADKDKIKKHFQDLGIPPRQRVSCPLVYLDAQLLAVGGHMVTKQNRANGEELGFNFRYNSQDDTE